MNDTLGLQHFFDTNKIKYTFSVLSKNKGEVMNDYQSYLEKQWLQELKGEYAVEIKKRTLKKLLKSYRN